MRIDAYVHVAWFLTYFSAFGVALARYEIFGPPQLGRVFFRRLLEAERDLHIPETAAARNRKEARFCVRGFTRRLLPVLSGGVVFRSLSLETILQKDFQQVLVDIFLSRAQRACDLEAVARTGGLVSKEIGLQQVTGQDFEEADDITVAEAAQAAQKAALLALATGGIDSNSSEHVQTLRVPVPRLNPSDVSVQECHEDGSLNFVVRLDKFADPADPSRRVRQQLRSVVAATKAAFHLILNDPSGQGLVLLVKHSCDRLTSGLVDATAVAKNLRSTSGYISESDEWRVQYQDYELGKGATSPLGGPVHGIDTWDQELDNVEGGLRDLELAAAVLRQQEDMENDTVPRLRHVAGLVASQMKMLRAARERQQQQGENPRSRPSSRAHQGSQLNELQDSLHAAQNTIELMKSINATSADVGALFGMSVRAFQKVVESRHLHNDGHGPGAASGDAHGAHDSSEAKARALEMMKRVVSLESKKKLDRKRQQRQRDLVEWYQKNPSVIEEFALRNPDTISLRVFVRPVHGAYFFNTGLNLSQKTREMLAALCDREVRAECTFEKPKLDTNLLRVRDFDFGSWTKIKDAKDGQSQHWLEFQRWFQAPTRGSQMRRFNFTQREVACATGGWSGRSIVMKKYAQECGDIAAAAVNTDKLHFCEWYENQRELRTQFLTERVALVQEYITLQEKDRRLDLLAEGEAYDPDALRVWETYPEIDIFDMGFDEKMERVRLANQPRKKRRPMASSVVEAWERFVRDYCLNKKRWWTTCAFGLDPHDDHLMQEADRAQRETNLMMAEDAAEHKLRGQRMYDDELRRQREIMDMMEEDRLARMLRDQCIYFSFLDTMSTRTRNMDPSQMRPGSPTARPEWRYRRGLGVDNQDELYDEEREREARERKLMQQEEERMRAWMQTKEEQKMREQAIDDAKRREQLEHDRSSRLWQLVVKQRREDRERRDDPDGMTRAEREAWNNQALAREDALNHLRREMERVQTVRAACTARNAARLAVLADAQRVLDDIAGEDDARRAAEDRAREAEELKIMAAMDRESSAAEAEARHRAKQDAEMRDALAPFTPFYSDHSGSENEVSGGAFGKDNRAWVRNELATNRLTEARRKRRALRGEKEKRAKRAALLAEKQRHASRKAAGHQPMLHDLSSRYDPAAHAAAVMAGTPAPPSGFIDQGGGPGDRVSDLGLDDLSDSDSDDSLEDLDVDIVLRQDELLQQKAELKRRARRLADGVLLREVKPVEFVGQSRLSQLPPPGTAAAKSLPKLVPSPTASLPTSTKSTSGKRHRAAVQPGVDQKTWRDGGRGAPPATVLMPGYVQRREVTSKQRQVRSPSTSPGTSPLPRGGSPTEFTAGLEPSNGVQQAPVMNYTPHTQEKLDEKWGRKFAESRQRLQPEPGLVPYNHGVFGVVASKKLIYGLDDADQQQKQGGPELLENNEQQAQLDAGALQSQDVVNEPVEPTPDTTRPDDAAANQQATQPNDTHTPSPTEVAKEQT